MEIKNLIILSLFVAFFTFWGCDDSGVLQSKGDYVNGYAIFVDTGFIRYGGYYAVSLYTNQNPPYRSIPLKTDSLQLKGYTNPYHFRIYWEDKQTCYLAVVWKRSLLTTEIPRILGTFGCDTSYSCQNFKPVVFPNYTGANYNIICWSDTTR
jgi:hypothetical protein